MTIAAPPAELSEPAREFLQKSHHDLLIGGERVGAADAYAAYDRHEALKILLRA